MHTMTSNDNNITSKVQIKWLSNNLANLVTVTNSTLFRQISHPLSTPVLILTLLLTIHYIKCWSLVRKCSIENLTHALKQLTLQNSTTRKEICETIRKIIHINMQQKESVLKMTGWYA